MTKPADPGGKTPKAPPKKRPRDSASPPIDANPFGNLASPDEDKAEDEPLEVCAFPSCDQTPERPFPQFPLDAGADSFTCFRCQSLICLSHHFRTKMHKATAKLFGVDCVVLLCNPCRASGLSKPSSAPAARAPPTSAQDPEIASLKEEMVMVRTSLASISSFLNPPPAQTQTPQVGSLSTYASAAQGPLGPRTQPRQTPRQAPLPPPQSLPEMVHRSAQMVSAEAREEERRSRSLLVLGMPKEQSETAASLMTQLAKVLSATGAPPGSIVEVARLRPSRQNPDRPPPVRAVLSSPADARALRSMAHRLKDTDYGNIYIREDRPPAQVEFLRLLHRRLPELNKASPEGTVFKIHYRDLRIFKVEQDRPVWSWWDVGPGGTAQGAQPPAPPASQPGASDAPAAAVPKDGPADSDAMDSSTLATAALPHPSAVKDWAAEVHNSSQPPFPQELEASLLGAQELYSHYGQLSASDEGTFGEREWLATELRNSLRSVEWELEDLEETLSVVERNRASFALSSSQLAARRRFVADSRHLIKDIRDNMAGQDSRFKDRNSLLNAVGSYAGSGSGGDGGKYKYSRLLENEGQGPASAEDLPRGHPDRFVQDTMEQQQLIFDQQEGQMEHIGSSVGVLKDMSARIGGELDEQALMLDDLGNAMERTDSKMDNVMKKIAKVTHMSNDRRQWYAIGVLVVLLLVLFIVLIS